uniref:Ground-like domain-containing protein n=1 Tax=Heligmosomoides polygyrus TaxID=6339 RepID=A0A183F3E9_HELPZ
LFQHRAIGHDVFGAWQSGLIRRCVGCTKHSTFTGDHVCNLNACLVYKVNCSGLGTNKYSVLLRKIWNQFSIGEDTTGTKRSVHRAVTRAFDGSFGVICAQSAFSYIVHAHEYCVHTKNDITCLVYKDG